MSSNNVKTFIPEKNLENQFVINLNKIIQNSITFKQLHFYWLSIILIIYSKYIFITLYIKYFPQWERDLMKCRELKLSWNSKTPASESQQSSDLFVDDITSIIVKGM